MNLNNKWTALIIFAIISLAVFFPIFSNISYWGQGDWDQHFFYNEVPRQTILDFHEIPLWDPAQCGGNVLLAHPESVWLSPFFIFVLIFGTVLGLKIQILLHMILGMFGMFLLSKHLKIKTISCYIPPIIFMLSSWFMLHLFVGHTLYLTMVYLPFALLFFLKSFEKPKLIIFSAIALVLMFFGGGTYPFVFAILFMAIFSLFSSIKDKELVPIKRIAIIIVLTLLLGAVKFIPSYFFIGENSYPLDDSQPVSFSTLATGLFSRDQDIKDSREFYSEFIVPHREYQQGSLKEIFLEITTVWNWHEYSGYIGIISFILFLVSLLLIKRDWEWFAVTAVFFILYFGQKGILYSILNKFPVFSSLHGSSRFIIIIVFCISILAGKAASFIEESKLKQRKIIMIVAAFIILIDLATIIFPYSAAMFSIEPDPIVHSDSFYHAYLADQYTDQYENFLEGKGSINCYERMHLPYAASPLFYKNGTFYEKYKGEFYLLGNKGIIAPEYFSLNKIKIRADIKQDDLLIINQNYEKGWKAKGKEVINYKGLIAVGVTPNDKEIYLHYFPNSFIAGFLVSIITIVVCIYLLRKRFT